MKAKRILTLTLAAVIALSLFTATAFAAGGERADKAAQRAQERAEHMLQIQPLIDEVIANRAELAALKVELATQRATAAAHLAELKANLDGVTDEQLAEAQRIKAETKACRDGLKATNATMSQNRQQLKTARRGRDYDGVEAAYNGIITCQHERIRNIQQLIELNKQAAAI